MLTAAEVRHALRRRRPPYSERQHYEEYILQRIEGYKNSIGREELLRLGESAESRALAKELKRRGWRFVGPTTVYAFMQACGLVDDHLEGCAARQGVERERDRFVRPA